MSVNRSCAPGWWRVEHGVVGGKYLSGIQGGLVGGDAFAAGVALGLKSMCRPRQQASDDSAHTITRTLGGPGA